MRHFVRKQNALPFPYKKKKETEQLIHNYSCICKTKIKKYITTKGGMRRECSEDKCNNFCRQVVAASLEGSLSLPPCFVTSSPTPGLASLPLAKLTRTLAVYRWYVYCNNIKKTPLDCQHEVSKKKGKKKRRVFQHKKKRDHSCSSSRKTLPVV